MLFLRELYLAHALNFVGEFPPLGLLLLLLYILLTPLPSLDQTDYSRNNLQKFLIQNITVKHVTISFDTLMSLCRHTHGSTTPRSIALLFCHKSFV